MSERIVAGVYELGLAHDSNHEGRTAVIYVPLYEAAGPRLAVRDLDDFTAWVHGDGSRCVADECVEIQNMLAVHGRVQMGRYNQTHRPRFRRPRPRSCPSGCPSSRRDRWGCVVSWIVSTLTKPNTAWDTKEQADAEAIRLQPALSIVWFCAGVEEAPLVPQPCVLVPRTGERIVETVLGHLGLRTATTGEIA